MCISGRIAKIIKLGRELVRHLYHNKGEKYTFKTKSIANVLGKMLESRFLGE